MKITLQDLKIKVMAKADTFGKFSPADINCDDLLWLIAQAESAQQSARLTRFPQCKGCEYNPCDLDNNSDYCPARR